MSNNTTKEYQVIVGEMVNGRFAPYRALRYNVPKTHEVAQQASCYACNGRDVTDDVAEYYKSLSIERALHKAFVGLRAKLIIQHHKAGAGAYFYKEEPCLSTE